MHYELTKALKDLKNQEVIDLYNEYAAATGRETINTNDNFFVNTFFKSPAAALRMAEDGKYKYSHDYAYINGYGQLVSFDSWECDASPVDISALADWIIAEGRAEEILEK